MSFQNFGLSEAVLHGIQSMGFLEPTAVQVRAFPAVMSGRDVLACAPTGTGKTAAFSLPVLTRLGRHKERVRALVLEPTRELAAQVETALRDFARFTDLEAAVVYGGVGYGEQRELLKSGVDILVATPGRLLDHLQQGSVELSHLEVLVLDEMDKMLDMGFLPQVRSVMELCPQHRQTLLFSATLPPEVERLANSLLRDPIVIQVGRQRSPAETVSHAFYPVAMDQKFELLEALLERTNYDSVLIFVRTKDAADRVAARLKAANHAVAVLHSNKTQAQRLEALEGFKNARYEVMVATDIASRGIDVAGVSHVINYDVPQHPEDYVHRIGRTGRAQTVGEAFTIITAEDLDYVAAIERFIGQRVKREVLENFDYHFTTLLPQFSAGAAHGTLRRKKRTPFGKRR
jgi:ATP-dependent RNA helicase RhlE